MTTASDQAIAAAQTRHERLISGFVVVACASAVVAVGGSEILGLIPDSAVAWMVVAFCSVSALYYGWAYVQAGAGARSESARVAHGTLEVLIVASALVLDTLVSREFGLLGPAPVAFPLAILVGSLRLLPALSLWQGVLSAGIYIGVYAGNQGWTSQDPAMNPALHAYKALILLMCGVLAYIVARSLRRLIADSVAAAEEKTRLRSALGFYVPDALVDRVMSGDLTLQTERRSISVMFVDIRGFTTLSESADPVELLDKLNLALDGFSLEVQKHGGIVNKFLGDGLMALFGAPVGSTNHAQQAAAAALGIQRVAADLDASGAFGGLRIGIGVHCGEVVVGDVGGASHREYTAIGDVVNVASRVESTNKQLGTEILLTTPVREALGDSARVVEKERVQLKGRDEPVLLWELVG